MEEERPEEERETGRGATKRGSGREKRQRYGGGGTDRQTDRQRFGLFSEYLKQRSFTGLRNWFIKVAESPHPNPLSPWAHARQARAP